MSKFIVEDDFWSVFPEAKIGTVICRKIDNSIKETEKYEAMIKKSEDQAHTYLHNPEFSKNEVVRVWREAFQKFKTKKGTRASIEVLLKRVNNGNHIGTINPLVDIYNSISLKYAMPCGGEDIDAFKGDIKLTKAYGDQQFVPLGSYENSSPYPEEIIYKDEAGAICRCLNWRDSLRTMLTENTNNAFL